MGVALLKTLASQESWFSNTRLVSIRNEKERIIYCTRKRERTHRAHRESYDLRPFSGRNTIKLKGPPPPLFLPQFSSHSISISFRSYFITRSFILDLSLGVPQTNKATMVKPRHSRLGTRKASGMSWTLILTLLVTFTFLILILLALGILSFPTTSSGLPKPNDLSSIARNALSRSKGEGGAGERWVEIISWEPRAFVYHNFLTKEECEYLINIAKPSMHKSTVVDSETGKSKDSRVRTSSGTFLARGRDQVVRDIEKRIADFTFVPVEHGEGLQVLHYEVGQKYEPHYDYFMDDFNTKNGGQRIATVLMYLSDVEEGGETVFPSAKGNISSVPWWNELSDCGKKGLSIKPKMGDALLFWSMKPDATLDPSSLHGGCPVIKGDKWSCTKWMRVHEYRA